MFTFSLSELFGAISCFQGLLLIIFILNKKGGKKPIKISLVILMLSLILVIMLGALNYSGKIRIFPNLLRMDSPIHYLVGPLAFFYVLSSLQKNFRFRYFHLLILAPSLLNIIYFMPLYLSSVDVKLNYYNDYMANGSMILKWQYRLKSISNWIYLMAEFYLFFNFMKEKKVKKKSNLPLIRWFSVFLSLQFFSYSMLIIDHLYHLNTFSDPYKFAMNMTSLLLLSISTSLFLFPKLLNGAIFIDNPQIEKYSKSNLTEVTKEMILSKWNLFTADSTKPYLNPKLSISEIADKLNTNPQRLSQVINEKTGMNFNDAINCLRIEESKRLLATESYQKLTIDAIAHECGFNSKSPFYAAFKKNTGLSPKDFIISIKKV